jgi:hypothetical protein
MILQRPNGRAMLTTATSGHWRRPPMSVSTEGGDATSRLDPDLDFRINRAGGGNWDRAVP